MEIMTPGEKRALSSLTANRTIHIAVTHAPADIDIAAFGLNGDRRIGDDRYVILFSNERSPEGAITYAKQGGETHIAVGLDRLPEEIHRISITATHDDLPLRQAETLTVAVAGAASIDAKPHLGAEKAIMLVDLYRHGGDWRIGSVVQGFNGGLAALVEHFGGDVADDGPPPAPPPPATPPTMTGPAPTPRAPLIKVDLRKQKVSVSLRKLGIEHQKAEVTFIIDASGSMCELYDRGIVQETVERIAPIALRLDDDGSMDTWFYASRCKQVEALNADNLDGFIARTLPSPGAPVGGADPVKRGFLGFAKSGPDKSLGYGNDEPVVMNAVLQTEPERRTVPRLVILLTDGGIYESERIIEILRESSRLPIFWQFIGVDNDLGEDEDDFEDEDNEEDDRDNYGVLVELDTVDGRIVDNAGFFSVDDLRQISDEELYDRILSEFPSWLRAARAAGILA
ncbi:stress response protein SCP2 [Sphingomonas zeicaulis]|uniref:VWA domain-containing protein n=1 Tax=Sphingomonas zeicaulis TaxID=1632740 RepID=UPI003D1F380A